MSHFFHSLCRQRQEFQRKPKSISAPGSAGSQTPKLLIPFSAEGSALSLPCGATGDFPSLPQCRDRKALSERLRPRRPQTSQGSPPCRGRCLSERGGFSFPPSLCRLWRWWVSQALPHMPGPVAGWHKAGIVHARRPERRANCLSQLGTTICWQPDLCHYITGDSPTCKRISRTCLSSLILEKQ